MNLDTTVKEKLEKLGHALIDQKEARIVIPPMDNREGFWFGGGNMVEDKNGNFYLCGRYRNAGDSRYGLGKGERGLELAIFKSEDRGKTFKKVLSFSKKDLSYDGYEVISIEGSWLRLKDNPKESGISSSGDSSRVELYVSTEKSNIPYPKGLESFKKPGTGVWTIDIIESNAVESLNPFTIKPLLKSENSQYLHVKDPFGFTDKEGNIIVGFCTHPFCWSSSNSAYALKNRETGKIEEINYTFFPRGFTWDVAMTRMTDVMKVPKLGVLKNLPTVYLIFYDGGESVRKYEEHPNAVKRPRGYSCEEIGGLAFSTERDFPEIERLSINLPAFTSPYGTGASRYVSTLVTEEGIYATWEQSQEDHSQPLVMHFLSMKEVEKILS